MLRFQIVQRVVESLVESVLSQTIENTKREDCLRCIQHPVKQQVEGQSVGPNSVQNPRSPSSAQVKLEEKIWLAAIVINLQQLLKVVIINIIQFSSASYSCLNCIFCELQPKVMI